MVSAKDPYFHGMGIKTGSEYLIPFNVCICNLLQYVVY